jgi:FUN14 family.
VDIISEILALGGTSFVVGFIIGLFIRALSKVIALILGAFLAGLMMLASYGIVTINYTALGNMIFGLFSYLGSLALAGTAAPFFLGFAIGWSVAPRKTRKKYTDSYV